MVSELREVLDKQAADEWAAKEAAVEEDAGGSTVVTYDEFMRNIEGCSDAEELARIRDEILAQIRKKRILIMGQNKDDIVHGQRVRDVLVYINRLYVAKKKAERRLDLLHIDRAGSTTVTRPRGNSASSARSTLQPPSIGVLRARPSTYYEHRDDPVTLGPPQFTLYEILTNVGSLSAFAEFADQLGHGMLVEFWLNVEGIRQQPVTISIVESLWKGYFTVRVDELASVGEDTAAAVSEVQKCLKPWRASNSMELKADEIPVDVYERAFELVCEVQANVLRFLEEKDYPAFQRSVLYSRFLRSYVVTPRQEQISDTLFANIPNNQSQSQTAEPRQLSLV
ncbi:tRNA (guanine-N(7)-)-methyltransferase (tRNA(m7G46)-methyltransferase), partial [Linderina macrospora]